MSRRTVRAGDLDPDTPITEGMPEDPNEPEPPPGNEVWEVWEGYVHDTKRSWPPRTRVKAWLGLQRTADAFVKAFEEANAVDVAQHNGTQRYYVTVRVEMKRSLAP